MSRNLMEPRRKFSDYLIAFALFAATVGALGWAQTNQGVTRDEGTYFQAADPYFTWIIRLTDNAIGNQTSHSLTEKEINQHWRINNEHPGLIKTLFGFSGWLLNGWPGTWRDQDGEPVISKISAYRAPSWVLTGFAVALIFLLGAYFESRTAGLTAALLYITVPRLFFHGQLACFDSAITTCWLLVVYAYVRSLAQARWGLLTGIAFGLALATKHNAWIIPPVLLIHYLIVVWPDFSFRPFVLPRLPLAFVSMALLGPAIFFALWPWLWFEPFAHLKQYVLFHLQHSYYNMEYLGTNWGPPPLPIDYPFGMLLFTMPTVMLVLALIGLLLFAWPPLRRRLPRWLTRRSVPFDDAWRYPARRTWSRPGAGLNPRFGLLLLLNALVPIAVIALPHTPIFGGTKHFLPAYPFLALLAGIALSRMLHARTALGQKRRPALVIALVVLVVTPGALSTVLTHPFGLSQYNALAGGPAGGADLGLNRQYWGYATRQLLPWINRELPASANVYWHDTNQTSYRAYVHDHLLRLDIRYAGMERRAIDRSNFALVLYELHFNKYDYWIWDAYQTAQPVQVVTLDDVPLVALYRRPRPTPNPTPTTSDAIE